MIEDILSIKENKLQKNASWIAQICFVFVVLLTFISLFFGLFPIAEHEKGKMEIDDIWVDAEGNSVTLDDFSDTKKPVSVYATFNNFDKINAIIFRSRNMFVDVWVNGEQVYVDDRNIFKLFGSSPGSQWNILMLPVNESLITVELSGTACYGNSKGLIDNVYIGEPSSLHELIIKKNILVFLLNSFWQIFGIFLIIIYVCLHKYYKLGKDFLYLAFGTFFCAQWCNAETNMWQFFLGGSEIFHFIGYISLISIPIPFGLLGCQRLSGKWKRFAEIYSIISEVIFAITLLLHITGILEFHYTVIFDHILVIFLLPLGVKIISSYSQNEAVKKHSYLFKSAFAMLMILILIGVARYSMGYYSNYATYIRLSLFLFMTLLIICQVLGINTVFVKGMQAEFLHEQAITDYLTKFYNRTGFAEHRSRYETLEKNGIPFGIIQFDVNNLKNVNDNQGHEKGDKLICLASSGIYQSFGTTGKCYRMGGDEFLVVLDGENPKFDYSVGMSHLEEYCNYVNSVSDRTFDLKIAHGFAVIEQGESLTQVMERADDYMYENKRNMKVKK